MRRLRPIPSTFQRSSAGSAACLMGAV
jgi:hypothetical protein